MTIDEILKAFEDINYMYNNASKYDTLKRMLEELPNTAEWIDDDDHLSENTECSICNFYMLKEFKKRCKYCPNCGARMVESEEV